MMRPLLIALLGLAMPVAAQHLPLGLGIASPMHLSADRPLFFYGSPDGRARTATPLDRLTVREGPHHIELATAIETIRTPPTVLGSCGTGPRVHLA